jgi:hypothetical protein
MTVWSSLEVRCSGSRNFGDGESCGVLSERERVLKSFWGVLTGLWERETASEALSLRSAL